MTKLFVIDIGGTRIKYGTIENGILAKVENIASQASSGGDLLSKQVVQLISSAVHKVGIDGVAISTAGQVDPISGRIMYSGPTIPNYVSVDWISEILKLNKGLLVSVENDVNCALLAELDPRYECTLMVTIGTGIGGAMAVGANILHGINNSMGEIGYIPVDGAMFQERASTAALIEAVNHVSPIEITNGYQVFDAEQKYSEVHQIVEEHLKSLVNGLNIILQVFPANRMIIGGGISENQAFMIRMKSQLLDKLPMWLKNVEIEAASRGNNAGMIGAAKHWENKY